MNQEYVYGFFVNEGDGRQLLFEYGVFKTEESAWNKYEEIGFGRHVEVDRLELH